MKKIFGLILFLAFTFIFTGCESNEEMYKVSKVNDYLYEINFTDYRYDENLETVQGVEEFACSSVKNGNFYGRNYDFIFNDIVEFVAKVDAKENRHASIGVINNAKFKIGDDITGKYNKYLELIPNSTLDGINDAGVIASINVVPKQDTLPVTGTNPDGEKLHMLQIVRFVLDNADSADHAIELLNGKNIYGDCGEHYNIHVMIADKDKTFVVEFLDNKLVADEKKENEQIMTNFYVNLDDFTENAAGIERYNILKENYDEGNSFEGMWNLLRRVMYSQEYEYDREVEWYSEFLPQSTIKNMDEETKTTIDQTLKTVKDEYWNIRNNDIRRPANTNYWLTTHNSTYDIKGRKLRITVQENYDEYFEYTLD